MLRENSLLLHQETKVVNLNTENNRKRKELVAAFATVESQKKRLKIAHAKLQETTTVSQSVRRTRNPAEVFRLSNFLGSLPIPHKFREIVSDELKLLDIFIGAGSYGTVQLAVYRMNLVAVKTLTHPNSCSREDRLNECRFLALCSLLGFSLNVFGIHGSKQYVIELCARQKNNSVLRVGNLEFGYPEPVTLRAAFREVSVFSDVQVFGFTVQAIEALSWLHENGLIHCDFKERKT